MVIDGQTLITGSFNFTKAAEQSNAENLLIIKDPVLSQQYASNWLTHMSHSEPYTGRIIESQPVSAPVAEVAVPSAVEVQVPAPSSPTVANAALISASPTPPQIQSMFWLSKSGKRHNSRCKWYRNCEGHECGPTDGSPCKVCGG